MRGKYYGVYNIKREDECLGIFESTAEVCKFFGGIRPNRVSCAIVRKNPLVFGRERYHVEVFTEPTKNGVRTLLRMRYGLRNHQIRADGIYVREGQGWRLLARDYEGVV